LTNFMCGNESSQTKAVSHGPKMAANSSMVPKHLVNL